VSGIEEMIAYHDDMARVTSSAADGVGMAKAAEIKRHHDNHKRWATLLRTMLPPAKSDGPRLVVPFVRQGRKG
jgi:hypothetical protein